MQLTRLTYAKASYMPISEISYPSTTGLTSDPAFWNNCEIHWVGTVETISQASMSYCNTSFVA
jgi:hypothetical protein